MIAEVLKQTAAATVGTVAFAVLYAVPVRFWAACGLAGGCGWFLYALLTGFGWCSATTAAFLATLAVVFLARVSSVRLKCPATVFITTGIFPLVPGVGVYWTAYYIVTDNLSQALESGFSAVKVAVANVLGITVMLEVPNRFFHPSTGVRTHSQWR